RSRCGASDRHERSRADRAGAGSARALRAAPFGSAARACVCGRALPRSRHLLGSTARAAARPDRPPNAHVVRVGRARTRNALAARQMRAGPRRAQGAEDHRLRRGGGRARGTFHARGGRGTRRGEDPPVRKAAAHLVWEGIRSGVRMASRRGAPLRRWRSMVRRRLTTMSTFALEFEKPLLELEQKLAELKRHAAVGTASGNADTLDGEIRRLERRCAKLQQEIFNDLSRWQVVQLSRHPNRPYMLDYVQRL